MTCDDHFFLNAFSEPLKHDQGNFYGPPAGLEAAGIWYLQDGNIATLPALKLSIVGSFGAVLVRDGGTCGVEVGTVGD